MKKLLSMILVLCLCFGLIACSVSPLVESGESTEAADTKAQDETTAADETQSDETTPAVDPASEGEVELLDVEVTNNYYYTFEYSPSITAKTYQTFALSAECAQEFGALESKLEWVNDIYKTTADDIYDSFGEVAAAAASEDEYFSYSYVTSTDIVRASTNVFSASTKCEVAMPDYDVTSYLTINLNAATGEELTLSSVVTDTDKLFSFADARLGEIIGADKAGSAISDYAAATGADGMLFTIGYTGISLFFGEGDLEGDADYCGAVTIPYTDAPEIFASICTNVPESYIIPLNHGQIAFIDSDGNGLSERIALTEEESADSDDYYIDRAVYKDEEKITFNDYSYSAEGYIVRSGGVNYLYLDQRSDNDSAIFRVVNLDDFTCDMSKIYSFGFNEESLDESFTDEESYMIYVKDAFVNPKSFKLSTSMDVLSTYSGTKIYTVGEGGIPETADELYDVLGCRIALKLKTDITAETVDEMGNKTGEGELKAGTYITFAHTDGDKFVDFAIIDEDDIETSDYTDYQFFSLKGDAEPDTSVLYRVYEDRSDYPYTVNGIDESEIFEGIMYAG